MKLLAHLVHAKAVANVSSRFNRIRDVRNDNRALHRDRFIGWKQEKFSTGSKVHHMVSLHASTLRSLDAAFNEPFVVDGNAKSAIIERNVRFQEKQQKTANTSAPCNTSTTGKSVAPLRMYHSGVTEACTVGKLFG